MRGPVREENLSIMLSMKRYFTILAFAAITVALGYLYDPTEEDIQRALDFQRPAKDWGFDARKERLLKLLCIGGSNTHHGFYTKSLFSYLTNASAHMDWSATVDMVAEGGASPLTFVGRKYAFESRPVDTWPNVVLLDFSVNTFRQVPMDKIAETIDSLIRLLNFKYVHANVSLPDIMFLELFNAQPSVCYLQKYRNATVEDKMQFLNHNFTFMPDLYPVGEIRGCPTCKEIRSVADFYNYPTVSWRLMAYPAFEKYFLSENLEPGEGRFDGSKKKWPYIQDGRHITWSGGELLTDKLFIPFFSEVMRQFTPGSRRERKPDVQMFPLKEQPLELVSYVTWDPNPDNALHTIIRQPSEWKRQESSQKVDGATHGAVCFGTNDQGAVLELDFTVPKVCTDMGDCRVSVGFLHSWNTSWVGGLTCSLIQDVGNIHLVSDLFINSSRNGALDMHHTGTVQTLFNVVVMEGKHTVLCRKLDSKYSCLVTLSTSGTVVA